MNEARRNVMVGLFVLIGIVALASLVVMFGQDPSGVLGPREAYFINIRFNNANGIRAGTVVTIGGLDVGRVHHVGFIDQTRFDRGVNVVARFPKEFRLRDGTLAECTEPGLGMGRPPIRIIPPKTDTGVILESGAGIAGHMTSAVESIFPAEIVNTFTGSATQIGLAAAALTPVLDDLHKILEYRSVSEVDQQGAQGNLVTAIARLDAGLKHFNEVLGDPKVKSNLVEAIENLHAMTTDGRVAIGDLRKVAGEFREMTTDVRTLVTKVKDSAENLDDKVDAVAGKLIADLDLAAKFLTQLHAISEKINNGQGTLGNMLGDNELYESMVLTFRRLAKTAQEFELLLQEWQKKGVKFGM